MELAEIFNEEYWMIIGRLMLNIAIVSLMGR